MADDHIPRRSFLKGAGAAGTAVATALSTGLGLATDANAQAAQAAGPSTPQPVSEAPTTTSIGVTFTGAVRYEQAPAYLALGDVAVAPKLSLTEGNGKLLNYIAMGLPTVAFDTSVSREILGDLGIYAPAGDWTALATELERTLRDADGAVIRRIGNKNRTFDAPIIDYAAEESVH
jgi:glycosyltransferase involved in cell wall biosynthesis